MRTLRDFLLEEVAQKPMLLERTLEEAGWEIISNAGRLSNAAQDVIQFANVSKARDATKDKSKWKDIRKKLGPTGPIGAEGADFFLKFVKQNSKLDAFIEFAELSMNGVRIKLKGDWKKVGGSATSSWKVLKFWFWSCLTVYECKDADRAEFFKNTSKGELLILFAEKPEKEKQSK